MCSSDVYRVHIYVDGSGGAWRGATKSGASCGFAVLHDDANGNVALHGFFGALVVVVDRSDSQHLLAQRGSRQAAVRCVA